MLPKSMPSDKPLPSPWLPTTRNVQFWQSFANLWNSLTFCTLSFRCWWSIQTRNQGYPHQLWPQFVGLWSSSLRSQEVRWSRCTRQIPEILPINLYPVCQRAGLLYLVLWRKKYDTPRFRNLELNLYFHYLFTGFNTNKIKGWNRFHAKKEF